MLLRLIINRLDVTCSFLPLGVIPFDACVSWLLRFTLRLGWKNRTLYLRRLLGLYIVAMIVNVIDLWYLIVISGGL